MPSADSPRSPWLRGLDVLSITAFGGLFGLAAWRLGGWPEGAAAPGLVLAGAAGILAADLGTGLVHWLGDRCFDADTPILGPTLIRPFREHHDDPLAITRHGFLEVTGNNALFLLPIAASVAALAPAFGRDGWVTLLVGFLTVMAWVALASNPIHRWAHMRRPPTPARWLQRHSLILSPRHHARHHDGRFDRCFCVATGWMNPVLDRVVWLRPTGRPRRQVEGAQSARHAEAGVGRF